jgi:Putative auto-transporter adhesin, head GIN domain
MKQYFIAVAAACLFFISCKKEGTEQTIREFAVTNFTELNMGSNLEINVIKGASFSVKAEGRQRDVDDMKAEVQNGELKIWFTDFRQKRERVKVNISMPSLVAFDFSGNTHIDINGFTEASEVEGKITGNSKATIQMNTTQFTLNVSGNSELTVRGQAQKVWVNASGNSYVNAYAVPSSFGRATATGNSKIKLYASQELFADASGNSFIYFKGNPGGKFFSESGNSQIIEE